MGPILTSLWLPPPIINNHEIYLSFFTFKWLKFAKKVTDGRMDRPKQQQKQRQQWSSTANLDISVIWSGNVQNHHRSPVKETSPTRLLSLVLWKSCRRQPFSDQIHMARQHPAHDYEREIQFHFIANRKWDKNTELITGAPLPTTVSTNIWQAPSTRVPTLGSLTQVGDPATCKCWPLGDIHIERGNHQKMRT